MSKIMNEASDFVDQSLAGIVAANPNDLALCETSRRSVVRAGQAKGDGKVAIVTGGGYGHLPVFLGYVGQGMCDGCAVGNVFTSPSAEAIVECARRADRGAGVLFLFGNYMGDSMNFDMASELLEFDDIQTRVVKCSDDVASLPRERWQERRGVSGIFFAYKLVGAYVEQGHSLDEVADFARRVTENVSTFGFATSSCQIPGEKTTVFQIGEDETELGMGIHGEPGVERAGKMTSAELAAYLVPRLVADQGLAAGDKIAVLVNSLGATCEEELYVLYADVKQLLDQAGIDVNRVFVGRYGTSMEMAGASLSFLKMEDDFSEYLNAPASTPFMRF